MTTVEDPLALEEDENPEVVHWYPPRRRASENVAPAVLGAAAIGAAAVGAIALGALAIGALAIGRFAIGRLGVGDARFRNLSIDRLTIRSLKVLEP